MRELTKAGAAGSPDTVLGPIRREHLQRYSTLVVLILMFAVFALAVDKFLTSQNLLNIAQQISILTIVGAGLTFGFAAREMDLSVGFAVGLAAMWAIARVPILRIRAWTPLIYAISMLPLLAVFVLGRIGVLTA